MEMEMVYILILLGFGGNLTYYRIQQTKIRTTRSLGNKNLCV